MQFRCQRCYHPVELSPGMCLTGFACPACNAEVHIDPAERTLGRYELLEKLGQGAFASVWKARDTTAGGTVALKVAQRNDSDDNDLMHLLREARLTSGMKHPHIVHVCDVGQQEDYHYLVTQFVEGITLDEWRRTDPSYERIARLFAAAADAIDYAHRRRIVHRDLTPSNILIDAEDNPHLIDFGLSKRDGDETTMAVERYRQSRYLLRSGKLRKGRGQSGPIVGTLAYMSPEQARGEALLVNGSSDIYSLGVMLYEVLTGERPYQGTRDQILRRIVKGKPKRPRRRNPWVPPDLEHICLKAMAVKPAQRYSTARDMAADCLRAAAGLPSDDNVRSHGLVQRFFSRIKGR